MGVDQQERKPSGNASDLLFSHSGAVAVPKEN
jgi:hypothetical protein